MSSFNRTRGFTANPVKRFDDEKSRHGECDVWFILFISPSNGIHRATGHYYEQLITLFSTAISDLISPPPLPFFFYFLFLIARTEHLIETDLHMFVRFCEKNGTGWPLANTFCCSSSSVRNEFKTPFEETNVQLVFTYKVNMHFLKIYYLFKLLI